MQKSSKSSLFFILFIIISISQENQIVKLKVNKKENVKIINTTKVPNPNAIYINGQLIDSNTNTNTITIENIEDEIRLEWENKLTTCREMFYGLTDITEIDLSDFDSSDVNDMQEMFNLCTSLKIINLRNLNTEKVTSMSKMFANCSSLISIDVTQFNTSKVSEMDYMFYACYSLESLDLSNFDTSSNYYVSKMFMDCYKLKHLNLKGFKTDKIKNFNYMLNNCSSLKSLDLSSFDTSLGVSSEYMFYGCTSLTSLNISNFHTENNYYMSFMFAECKNLGYLNVKNLCEPEDKEFFFNDNILDNTPQNMVMCFTTSKASKLNNIFTSKNCELLYCNEDWKDKQTKVNGETGECMQSCNGEFLYDYLNRCYRECPEGTTDKNIQYLCEEIKDEQDYKEENEKFELEKEEKIYEQEKINNYEIEVDNPFKEENEKEKEKIKNYEIEVDNPFRKENEKEREKIKNHEIEVDIPYREEKEKEREKEKIKNHEFEVDNPYKEEKEKETEKEKEKNNTEEEEIKDDEKEKNTEMNDPKISTPDYNYYNTNFYIKDTSANIIKTYLNTEYINNCNITSFFKKECQIITQSNEQRKELITNIITNLQDGSLKTIINSLISEEKNMIIENEEDTYSLGTLENQNLNETKTLIELGNCEKELKRVYNISEEEKILIFKIEKLIPGYKIPIISYELFTQNGEINLDLD